MRATRLNNLFAEQARRGDSDSEVAEIIGITRENYGLKKHGIYSFKKTEKYILCDYFKCDEEYLFEQNDNQTKNVRWRKEENEKWKTKSQ